MFVSLISHSIHLEKNPLNYSHRDKLVQSRPGCTGNGNCHVGRKFTMTREHHWGDLDLRSLTLKKERGFKITFALGHGNIVKVRLSLQISNEELGHILFHKSISRECQYCIRYLIIWSRNDSKAWDRSLGFSNRSLQIDGVLTSKRFLN